MKKTLSMLAVLGVMCMGIQSANAFSWSSLNPANWGHCNKCQKIKKNCDCNNNYYDYEGMTGGAANCDPCKKKNPCKKIKKCDPCQKVTPCNPCQKEHKPCDPCNQLQNMNK